MKKEQSKTTEKGNVVLPHVGSRFNLIWDVDTNCENDFRSELFGKPIYDMKCNNCLSFVGVYHSPEDCEVKYCFNCGQKIEQF
ncbi:MAG: hypothetical protein ACLFQA_00200 [Bacteroidales bacterium]